MQVIYDSHLNQYHISRITLKNKLMITCEIQKENLKMGWEIKLHTAWNCISLRKAANYY